MSFTAVYDTTEENLDQGPPPTITQYKKMKIRLFTTPRSCTQPAYTLTSVEYLIHKALLKEKKPITIVHYQRTSTTCLNLHILCAHPKFSATMRIVEPKFWREYF